MKVIEDILKEVDQEVLRKAPHAQRKYNKITESLRVKFLNKIFQENKSIKKAAEELNINYSSAKTILTMHRKKNKQEGTSTPSSPQENDYSSPRVLPPKHMIKQSFMSTASNLSEQKDYDDSCSDHQEDAIKASMTIKKPVVLVSPNFQQHSINNNTHNLSLANNSPVLLSQQMQNAPQIVTPQQTAQISQQAPSMANINSNLLLQIQQTLQAQQQQQQQQQLQNALQQILLLQNAYSAASPQQNQTPSVQNNSLAALLLQQQLLLLSQLGNTSVPIAAQQNWI